MGGTGQGYNGLSATGTGGGGFLSGIPWWVYLIVMLIGAGLSIFCFLKFSGARRRAQQPPLPGAPPPLAGAPPPGGGNGFLTGGISSALLLVVAPLVVMLIMQPWNNSNWLVGRWGQNPACTGQTVEFTSDGFVVSMRVRKSYRLEGDRITVDGRTEVIRHNGDQFTVEGQTFSRCSGSETAAPFETNRTPEQPASVPSAGAEFVGTWSVRGRDGIDGHIINQTVRIVQNGPNYLVTVMAEGSSSSLNGTFPATYERGILHTSTQLGDIGYSEADRAILVQGIRFPRVSAN